MNHHISQQNPDTIQSYQGIQDRIKKYCEKFQRSPSTVKILAVSKKQSIDKIGSVYDFGHRYFGENYAQELFHKAETLSHLQISWSFIGTLQSNKIRKLVKYCDEIQTVASPKQASMISHWAEQYGKSPYPIYLHVNYEREEQKGGVKIEDIPILQSFIQKDCPHLLLQGIMAIPAKKSSIAASSGQIPLVYHKLREAAETIGEGLLSLGMSLDMEAAIGAGSNCIRIGTGIFGARI